MLHKNIFILSIISVGLGALVFQNCAPQGFRVLDSLNDPSPLGILSIETCGNANLAADQPSGIDACVYLKSPYYQKQLRNSAEVIPEFGVTLTGLDNSGYLKNEDFQVIAEFPVRKVNEQWHHYSIPQDGVAQFSAYYYSQNLIEFVKRKVPSLRLSGIKINIGSQQSGWAPATNEIFLKRNASGLDLAYDGSLVTYFLALAIIDKLSNSASQVAPNDPNHRNCGPSEAIVYENDCCNGKFCINALTSGMADYLVSAIVSEAPMLSPPTLGEYVTNRPKGLGHCGLFRSLNEKYDITQAFNACQTAPAQIHNLGSVYAQTWWQARKAVPASDIAKFDEFFLAHIQTLASQDDIKTLMTKTKDLDSKKFASKFFNHLVIAASDHHLTIK